VADYLMRRTMMVDTQVRPSDVTKFPIIAALLDVAREDFVPEAQRETAYVGEHLHIGGGRVLLDPRIFAKLLDAVDIQPDETVLDLGCGLGYSAAVLARLGRAVTAVEADPDMAARARRALAAAGADTVTVVQGPLALGAPKAGTFDVVIVEGGVEDLPAAILSQVRPGGRIAAVFVNQALGEARIGHKSDNSISWRFAFNATAPVVEGFAAAHGFVL